MAVESTTQLTHYPLERRLRVGDIGDGEPWYIWRLTFRDNSRYYILSHKAAGVWLPPGEVVLPAQCLRPPNIIRSSGLISGIADISDPVYQVADEANTLSFLISDKSAGNEGTLGIRLEDFEVPREGSNPNALHEYLVATFELENDYWDNGVLTLGCTDVQRNTDAQIWPARKYRLRSTLSASDMRVPTDLNDLTEQDFDDVWFAHDDRYDYDPGVPKIAYNKLPTGEIYSFKSRLKEDGIWYDMVHKRGALSTENLISAIEVSADTELQNLPAITEVPYIEEEATDMLGALLTRWTHDGRRPPPSWSPEIDRTLIDWPSFARAATGFRLSFRDPGPQGLKRFYEREILVPKLAALSINERGALEWLTIEKPRDNSGAVAHITSINLVEPPGAYRRNLDKIRNPLTLEIGWSHVSKAFRTPLIYDNQLAMRKNPVARAVSLAFRGVHPGLHTEAQMFKLAGVIGDQYFWETGTIPVQVDLTERGLKIGEVVRVTCPQIPDALDVSGLNKTLDRSFVIVGTEYVRRDRSTKLRLACGSDATTSLFEGQEISQMPVSMYKEGGIDIATLPGTTNNNGVLSGSPQLEFNQKYYYVDDANPGVGVEFAPSYTPTKNGVGSFIELWVYGVVINKSATAFDLTGKGLHAGGRGSRGALPPEPGATGYFGVSVAGSGLRASTLYRRFTLAGYLPVGQTWRPIRPIAQRPGVRSVPDLALSINNGVLEGWPSDQSGSGGNGAHGIWFYDPNIAPSGNRGTPVSTYVDGLDGPRGGAGLKTICFGWANAGDGKVVLDAAPAPLSVQQPSGYHLARPGPAQPGVWIIGLDGNHLPPSIGGDTFSARNSDCTMPVAERLPADQVFVPTGEGRHSRSHYDPQAHVNMWRECHRIVRMPKAGTTQTIAENFFDREVRLNLDNNVRLYVEPVPRSGANDRDLSVTQAELDRETREPIVHRYNASTGLWDEVGWPDDFVFMRIEVERRYGSGVGSTTYFGTVFPDAGEYARNDTFLNTDTSTMWLLGPPHTELFREQFGFNTAVLNADPDFALTMSGLRTLYATATRGELPIREAVTQPTGPGITTDEYTLINAGNYFYSNGNDRAVRWDKVDGYAQTGPGNNTETGDAAMYIDNAQGHTASNFDRQVWVYARAPAGGVLKIQSHGVPTGDPSRQADAIIPPSTAFAWIKATGGALAGLFKQYSNQCQVHTAAGGIDLQGVLLLKLESVSTPVGPQAFEAPAGGSMTRGRMPGNTGDVLNPIPTVSYGSYGEGGGFGARLITGNSQFALFGDELTIPISNARQITARVRCKTAMGGNLSPHEGVGVDLRLYSGVHGTLPRLQNPQYEGNGDMLYKSTEWGWYTEVFDIPPGLTGAVQLQWAVVGSSTGAGEAFVSQVLIERTYHYNQSGADEIQIVNNPYLPIGQDGVEVHDVIDFPVHVAKGAQVSGSFSGELSTTDESGGAAIAVAVQRHTGGSWEGPVIASTRNSLATAAIQTTTVPRPEECSGILTADREYDRVVVQLATASFNNGQPRPSGLQVGPFRYTLSVTDIVGTGW